MSGIISRRQTGGDTDIADITLIDERVLDERGWQALLAWRRGDAEPMAATPAQAAFIDLYRPFCTASPGRSVVIAHLGQSLDGRIATVSGLSRWVTGAADLLHTHRMRALADAVIVGAGTVEHDDPQLTVRRCTGRHPVRVVIDPDGRLAPTHRIFDDVEAPTLVVTADDGVARDRVDTVRLPREGAVLSPPAMVAALAARGLHRLFIEGGGVTVSRFLAARCLDRLQLTVAPLLLGSGRPSLALPEILDPADGLRPRVRRVALDEDTLFECIFRE